MEEKLLKLLSYLNDKWNKELDQKMKDFKRTTTSTSTSSSSGSSSSSGLGGFLRSAVSYASVAMPQLGVAMSALRNPTVRSVVKNVAGPALAAAATAAGQPELAPVALRYGPELVDLAASAATPASGASGSAGPGSSSGTRTTTTTKDTADGIGSDKDDQLKLMEIQRILDQQKEMFSLVSNLLRTTHDTRMSLIQNVR